MFGGISPNMSLIPIPNLAPNPALALKNMRIFFCTILGLLLRRDFSGWVICFSRAGAGLGNGACAGWIETKHFDGSPLRVAPRQQLLYSNTIFEVYKMVYFS
jgi:hypothetical protein